jgi:hypothetical protein
LQRVAKHPQQQEQPMYRRLIAIAALSLAAAPDASAAEVVPLPLFQSIELNGGGRVVIRHGAAQRVTILNGSSDYTSIRVTRRGNSESDRLVIEACNARCPQHYNLQIEIVTADVSAVAINGGGEILVEPGFPREQDVAAAVEGGGAIDLRALSVSDVAASVSGGGELLVNARDSLSASVNGGGAIRYWGNPAVSTSIDGGGIVRRGR